VQIKDTDPTPAPPLQGRGVISNGVNIYNYNILSPNTHKEEGIGAHYIHALKGQKNFLFLVYC